jgi:hypothetical protein
MYIPTDMINYILDYVPDYQLLENRLRLHQSLDILNTTVDLDLIWYLFEPSCMMISKDIPIWILTRNENMNREMDYREYIELTRSLQTYK